METQKTLTITNDGPRIVTTNYWDTDTPAAASSTAQSMPVRSGSLSRLSMPRTLKNGTPAVTSSSAAARGRRWPSRMRWNCSSKTLATPHTACILSRGRSICCPAIQAKRNGSSPPGCRGQPWLSSGPRSGDASSVSRGSRLGNDALNLFSHPGGRPWFSDGAQE